MCFKFSRQQWSDKEERIREGGGEGKGKQGKNNPKLSQATTSGIRECGP